MNKNSEQQMKHTESQLPALSDSLAVSEEELDKAAGGLSGASVLKIRKSAGPVVEALRPTIWSGGKAGTKGGSIR